MVKAKVLVTGGCGFIGREVIKQLIEKDYHVIVVDDFSNSTPLVNTHLLKIVNFDLRKDDDIDKIFKDTDYCIHLAAKAGGIKYTTFFPGTILRDNLLIDANIINAANRVKIKKIVYASTAIVYDQLKDSPYKEIPTNFLPIPKSNYGFSKLVGERLCQSFNQEKGLNYTIARIFNVYGVNSNIVSEKNLHVIPDLIRKISNRKDKLKLYEGGMQKRTFIHVYDVASALIRCMENPKADGEIFNVASQEDLRILDLAKMIWELLKREDPFYVENIPALRGDLMNNLADISKIKRLIGWKAKKSMSESLPEIVKWYSRDRNM